MNENKVFYLAQDVSEGLPIFFAPGSPVHLEGKVLMAFKQFRFSSKEHEGFYFLYTPVNSLNGGALPSTEMEKIKGALGDEPRSALRMVNINLNSSGHEEPIRYAECIKAFKKLEEYFLSEGIDTYFASY